MVFDFGCRLRELRLMKKMTQSQVAARLGLSKAVISGYENNIKTPSLEVLAQISLLYGVSTDYLLGLDNRNMLLVDGLTESQQEILKGLLAEFRSRNP